MILKKIGSFDQHEIYRGIVKGYPELYCLEIRDGDKSPAFLVYRVIMLYGVKYANVLRVWVDQSATRQGWASRLYTFITKELRFPVLSDEEQTPESEMMYRSFIKKRNNPTILDIKTGETFDAKTFDLEKVYTNGHEPTDYRIVLNERALTMIEDLPGELREQLQYVIFGDGDF